MIRSWFFTFLVTAAAVSLIAGCPPKKERAADEPPVVEAVEPSAADINEPGGAPVVSGPVAAESPVESVVPVDPVEAPVPEVDVNVLIAPLLAEANEPAADANGMAEPNEAPPPEANAVAGAEEAAPPTHDVATAEPNAVVEPNIAGVVEPNIVVAVDPGAADANAPAAAKVTFHDRCADLLKTYVTERGLVDYASLSRKRLEVKAVLAEFDTLDPEVYKAWPEADKLAFWINAYNIQMLHVIAQNFPITGSPWLRAVWGSDSIRHITGISTDYKFMVMREQYTLEEIERRYFMIPTVDPKVLLALCQGCLSGPPLRNVPYTGEDLDKQLDAQVRRFLEERTNLRIDRSGGEVELSSLLQATWYGKAFAYRYGTDKKFKGQPASTAAVLNFLCRYVGESEATYLEIGTYTVKWSKFDWTVNDKSKR